MDSYLRRIDNFLSLLLYNAQISASLACASTQSLPAGINQPQLDALHRKTLLLQMP